MLRGPAMLLALLLGGAAHAKGVNLSVGPDLQVAGNSSEGDTPIATGVLLRGLVEATTAFSWGASFEGLWLTAPEKGSTEQDLLLVGRLMPPTGPREKLAVDFGAGVARSDSGNDHYHPTWQIGLGLQLALGRRFAFEAGARMVITPTIGKTESFVPSIQAWRFNGVLSARL